MYKEAASRQATLCATISRSSEPSSIIKDAQSVLDKSSDKTAIINACNCLLYHLTDFAGKDVIEGLDQSRLSLDILLRLQKSIFEKLKYSETDSLRKALLMLPLRISQKIRRMAKDTGFVENLRKELYESLRSNSDQLFKFFMDPPSTLAKTESFPATKTTSIEATSNTFKPVAPLMMSIGTKDRPSESAKLIEKAFEISNPLFKKETYTVIDPSTIRSTNLLIDERRRLVQKKILDPTEHCSDEELKLFYENNSIYFFPDLKHFKEVRAELFLLHEKFKKGKKLH